MWRTATEGCFDSNANDKFMIHPDRNKQGDLTMRLSGRETTYGARLTQWKQINLVSCDWHFMHHGPLQPIVRLPRHARIEAASQQR
jgi:hypothetical protein